MIQLIINAFSGIFSRESKDAGYLSYGDEPAVKDASLDKPMQFVSQAFLGTWR